jgi:hypothetical protein
MSETDPYAAPVSEEAKFDTTEAPYAGVTETPAVQPVNVPQQADLTVPEGSIKNVLGWVGDDRTKAQAALDAENKADDPRSTLVSKLEDILA